MRPKVKNPDSKPAFTIIELLTVLSIIVILIGLLVPSLNKVRRYARLVKQKAQFHSIQVAMDLFSAELEEYPPSGALGADNKSYCGAMKLAEAMVGQDLLGFHPDSAWRSDGFDGSGTTNLYPDETAVTPQEYSENLKSRKGPYLQLDNANAYPIGHIYGDDNCAPFDANSIVLCDVYTRVKDTYTGKKIGMPILYYRADTSKSKHDYTDPDNSIYNVLDNDELVKLGIPWDPAHVHPIDSTGGTTSTGGTSDIKIFYDMTWNPDISTTDRPYNSDSYILLSAGFDGEYGTRDDVFNFGG